MTSGGCACLWPDQPQRVARLEAEMTLAPTAPSLLVHGDAVEVVPGAVASARRRPACRHHDVDAVALPAREPPALPAPPRPSGGQAGGGVGVSGGGRSRAGDTDTGRSLRL